MSHFSVLVVGGNVEEQLQPYHEFECTGTDDQYVQEIDQTEEAREQFNSDTTTCVRNPDGELEDRWTEDGDCRPEFYRDPTPEEEAKHGKLFGSGGGGGISWTSKDWGDGRGYRGKVYELPEGWTEVKVPTSTRQTFAEFCEDYYGHTIVPFGEQPNFSKDDESSNHKYGYTIVDEQGNVVKTIDRTNPNAKWDWYSVGGRWNGHFKLKPLAVGILSNEASSYGFGERHNPPGEDRADIIMKGDIDVEGMRNEAGEKAADRWDRFHAIIAGLPEPITWKQMQEKHRTGAADEDGEPVTDWEAARTEFHAQPAVLALRNSKDRDAIWWEVDEFMVPREQFVQHWRNRALSTFAVVKDGVWYEKGRMGWWGMVADEKEQEVWDQQVAELVDGLPDNTLLTVVDCHI
jgi:hypothetical protein